MEVFSSYPRYTANELIKRIAKYKVISFDVFDTLIKRSVAEPHDVFDLTAIRFNESHEKEIDVAQFRANRINAAIKAREKNKERGIDEVNISEIYESMPETYKDYKVELQSFEIKAELTVCHANPEIKRVYEWCLEHGKRVIVISDMYLPMGIIKNILDGCGYDRIDKIYLSSDLLKRKQNGALVSHVKEEEDTEGGSAFVHIGDNYHSDWLQFKRYGLKAILIARNPYVLRYTIDGKLSKSDYETFAMLKKILNNSEDPSWNPFYKFGFECEGPLLYGFSGWLNKQLREEKFDKVFFMARDGYLMLNSYNALYGRTEFKGEYMYISRRAVHFPLLWKYPDLREYLSFNGTNKRWSYITLSNRLGMDANKALRIWEEYGLNEKSYFKIKDLTDKSPVLKFYDAIKDEAIKNSRQEYDLMLAYLDQIGFTGRIALVDSGGGATTQKILQEFCNAGVIDAEITGFYLWYIGKSEDINCRSYAIDFDIVGGETVPTELPLTAYEGTTTKYERRSATIEPVLDGYEFDEELETQNAIEQVQAGCLEFVEIMRKNHCYVSLNGNVAYHNSMMTTRYPRMNDVILLGNFRFHSDNEDTYLAKPRGMVSYLAHPNDLISELKIIRWKIGFLKRLLRVPLPYYRVLTMIKKLTRMHKSNKAGGTRL